MHNIDNENFAYACFPFKEINGKQLFKCLQKKSSKSLYLVNNDFKDYVQPPWWRIPTKILTSKISYSFPLLMAIKLADISLVTVYLQHVKTEEGFVKFLHKG